MVIELLKETLQYLMKNWIAIAAFIISLITLRRNSIKIDTHFSNTSKWIMAILFDDGSSMVNEEFGLIASQIKIINTSNFDIGYFDLSVIDSTNNTELNYYRNAQFNIFNDLASKKAISYFDSKEISFGLNLPDSSFGVIKAHSMTSIDLIVSPEIETKELFVMFKVTKRKSFFKRPKHGYINSPYEQFSATVRVEVESKPDYEKHFADLQNK